MTRWSEDELQRYLRRPVSMDVPSTVHKKSKPVHYEHDEQVALFKWASLMEPQYPALSLLYAIPNGGQRHPAVAARLKAEGVKPGMPDICLPVSNDSYNSLYIELKIEGNKPTDLQLQQIRKLNASYNLAVVCYGFEQARDLIIAYLEEKGLDEILEHLYGPEPR